MKLRLLSLLPLALFASVAHADEPVMGAYAGMSAGRATLHRERLTRSSVEAHDTAFKALFGYRSLRGLAFEASYADFGNMNRRDRLPRAWEKQIGYFCLDAFTPITSNVFKAARAAAGMGDGPHAWRAARHHHADGAAALALDAHAVVRHLGAYPQHQFVVAVRPPLDQALKLVT